MSLTRENSEVDIVIAALCPNIDSFLEEWRPFLAPFHLIIVQDPDLKEEPSGFDLQVYSKADMEIIASGSSINFSGYSCRYFGYLMSRKKYIISRVHIKFGNSQRVHHSPQFSFSQMAHLILILPLCLLLSPYIIFYTS